MFGATFLHCVYVTLSLIYRSLRRFSLFRIFQRLPHLKGQLADTEKRIENLMNAIEQGIITDTTKDRLAQLESKKKEIEIAILQEKIKKPFLTKEQIQFGIERFRNLDITTFEGKRRLIDGFVNSIYLYDDRFDITFNFKDGTQTVFFSELEATKNSDIKSLGAPLRAYTNTQIEKPSFRFLFLLCCFRPRRR